MNGATYPLIVLRTRRLTEASAPSKVYPFFSRVLTVFNTCRFPADVTNGGDTALESAAGEVGRLAHRLETCRYKLITTNVPY